MKRVAILLGLGVFLTVSCAKREQEAQVSNVNFTPCQQIKVKSTELSSGVEVEFTNEGVQITHYGFEVTCDFTIVIQCRLIKPRSSTSLYSFSVHFNTLPIRSGCSPSNFRFCHK